MIVGGGANGSGVVLDAASRGLKCAVIEKFDFDVILMDINLGDDALDGTEVMLKIKANPNKNFIKIYAVTSYALPEDRDRFLNFGFDYYFPKPINKDLIIEKIKEDIT